MTNEATPRLPSSEKCCHTFVVACFDCGQISDTNAYDSLRAECERLRVACEAATTWMVNTAATLGGEGYSFSANEARELAAQLRDVLNQEDTNGK